MSLRDLYRPSLALLTDLYQVTMAQGYWKAGLDRRGAVFQLNFRRPPFGGAFAVACGLEAVVDMVEGFSFGPDDLEYLASLRAAGGQPLFEQAFLDHLAELEPSCRIDAMPEGTICLAYEPILRVEGPLLLCQLLETSLLNLVNFQTLIATKSARICHLAAQGDAVVDFGLRRAQGIDGGVSAARAAYVGGAVATSNLLAGKLYGIPVRGTHAHSWVMAFESELESFRQFAASQPDNCFLLVDTYDTERGIEHAIEVGHELAASGHRLAGIRLDSGDLVELSRLARRRLDEEGLEDVSIVASGDLDEDRIAELRARGARVDSWGVGTRLITGRGEGALGGVYKLSAIETGSGEFRGVVKVSEEPGKSTAPGRRQVRRYRREGALVGDAIWALESGPPGEHGQPVTVSDGVTGLEREVEGWDEHEDLLRPLILRGRRVGEREPLAAARERVACEMAALPESARRLSDAEPILWGYERRLFERKMQLIEEARGSREGFAFASTRERRATGSVAGTVEGRRES
ncbi:MAG TPA: nicotinate phosphoribosyltransferase [Thermoanaerobaculia bacterium]|nr:nicotinate phosphoribosyltransferase [Thermoanaerobaculia bacterium]